MAASASAEGRVRRALAGLLLLCWAAWAWAHPMPESRVWIDTQPGGLRLTLQLPLNRLEFAFGAPLAEAPQAVLPQHADTLARYLLLHVGARSGDQGWQALRPMLSVQGRDGAAELEAVMELRAPPGADARDLTLLYDAVTHEVRTHRVQVFLRNDWAGGFVGQAPLPLGELNSTQRTLPLAFGATEPGAGVLRLVAEGARHILGGADHLLFLALLLGVAPLAARDGRWRVARPTRAAWRHAAGVVTAFTLGHTLTLALGSSGLVAPPAAAVEIGVALTLVAAAVHALRPWFGRAEVAMAALFGLVHGLAFSASLSGAGLGFGQHAAALLAFNLGIEAVQVLLIALLLPPLVRIAQARAPAYRRLRIAGAVVAATLALLWLAERLGVALPEAWRGLDAGGPGLAALPLLLWLLALATALPPRAVSR